MTAIDAVDRLIENGWEWKASDIPDPFNNLNKGWWIKKNAEDPRGMRRGDPKNFFQSALTTVELYEL